VACPVGARASHARSLAWTSGLSSRRRCHGERGGHDDLPLHRERLDGSISRDKRPVREVDASAFLDRSSPAGHGALRGDHAVPVDVLERAERRGANLELELGCSTQIF